MVGRLGSEGLLGMGVLSRRAGTAIVAEPVDAERGKM